ncbi:thioesterase-like [Hymenobacter roseosalivarius DSM 11622]|uniref:Thioesterase-like n=1 Tax=Hymenobacter roseosalivarius DSM 11622 TaxID=645990 RepID=A0A1W1VW39_9BACT|nr:hotdog domain-containing protein [Hymenobacter roseosalivarius]SMB97585.1 thioesterase-like [Hymenobacter roseosalivarius DSM 11622]
MKNPFQLGDVKIYSFVVTEADFATMEGHMVHEVLSTFALGRSMEWAGRLFVLEMLEAGEEGIGTMLHVEHHTPAFAGETVEFRATFAALENRELTCAVEVWVDERLVATGRTGQRIVRSEKLSARFAALRAGSPTSA